MGDSTRISLISYVGVSSGPALIQHFIDHYHRLGVDRFLLVLHAPDGDARTREVLAILERYGASPVERTTEFSTPRKLVRFDAILAQHCGPEDWVLYADTDEFHVYPRPLHELVAECRREGYEFVRGRLVDRVAVGGELRPIEAATPIFEQFACTANITADIRFGWEGKVCATQATRRLGEVGMHTLHYGGQDRQLNYDRTLFDTLGHPETIDVLHFRWDSTVVARLRDKFEGVGGDREIVDDPTFIAEYQRIWDHISQHGCISVPDARVVGMPQVHYER